MKTEIQGHTIEGTPAEFAELLGLTKKEKLTTAPLTRHVVCKKRAFHTGGRYHKLWNQSEIVECKQYLEARKLGLLRGNGHLPLLAKKIGRTVSATSAKLSELRKGGFS